MVDQCACAECVVRVVRNTPPVRRHASDGIQKARSVRRAARSVPSADADGDGADGADDADPLRAAFDVLFGRPGPDVAPA